MQKDMSLLFQKHGISSSNYLEEKVSSVTTAWGVDWDEHMISRDLIQNFYDANRDNPSLIEIYEENKDIVIFAPSIFEIDRLFYLGSEKGKNDIGQYGEGFKAATLNIIKKFKIFPIITTAKRTVVITESNENINNTKLRPLVYHYYETESTFTGTKLIIQEPPIDLKEALLKGMEHFYYPENTLLGDEVCEEMNDGVGFKIHKSVHNNDGVIFYKNLKRGIIKGIPLVLVLNKEYKRLENKISKDRDRNAFDENISKVFYSCFVMSMGSYNDAYKRLIVEYSKSIWTDGHILLSSLKLRYKNESWIEKTFENKYFAKTTPWYSDFLTSKIEQEWIKEGKIRLPSYFHDFGLINAFDENKDRKEQALKNEKITHQKSPTENEINAIRFLSNILKLIDKDLYSVFFKNYIEYYIIFNDNVLGALKTERSYNERTVYLNAKLFEDGFEKIFSTLLHEFSHIYGRDGSRNFTDALTMLIENILIESESFHEYKKEWVKYRDLIIKERNKSIKKDNSLEYKSKKELLGILNKIPDNVLSKYSN